LSAGWRAVRGLACAGALALGVGLSACGGNAPPAGGPALSMARVGDAVVLDPSHAVDGLSLDTTSEVMQNLVTFRPGSFDVVGDAAARWWSSADGKVWTFELRPHLVFSDGTPLDAQAVKFNFDRWRLRSDPAHGNFAYPKYADDFGGFPGVITDVRAPSPTRVVITLARPLGPFLRDIADPSFGIGSPAAITTDPKRFELEPVGSGAYAVAEWQRGDHITLVANPRFAGPKPAFPTVIIRDVPDPATSVLSIEKGDVDMLTDPARDDARTLAAQSDLAVVGQPPDNVSYLAMDVEKSPFGDVRVRRAVAYAIDVASLTSNLYANGAVAADNWTPPGMLGANPAVKAYSHDLAKARALLAAAGFPHGFATTLSYSTTPRPSLPEAQRVAETLQAELGEAGIVVTLQPSEWSAFLDKIEHRSYDVCLAGWTSDNGDPDNFFSPLRNDSFGRDPAFHRLMLAGRAAVDDAQRRTIYRRANAMVHDSVPAIPLVHAPARIVIRSSLKGFVPSPNNTYHFSLIHG